MLRDDVPTASIDAVDAERWLTGKKWDEIAADYDQMDVEMPHPCLSVPACCYFLGGYLLHLAEAFDGEYVASLAPIHFAGFMGSERFAAVMPRLSQKQRAILGEFATEMLANDALFSLGEEFSAKLKSAARLLTGGQ